MPSRMGIVTRTKYANDVVQAGDPRKDLMRYGLRPRKDLPIALDR